MMLYLICLVLGLMFTFISAIAGHFFGGGDGHADIGTGGHAEAGFDHSGMPGISFFSPTVLASFVTAFGAFGMIFSKIPATSSYWVSAPLAGVSGGIIASLVFWFFNAMFEKTQSSSESRVSTLVGLTASIITPIPANGVGEIAYVQSGSRYTAPARSEGGQPIGCGQAVKITRIVGAQFYVQPVTEFATTQPNPSQSKT
jgi:membrane protein implicated in regulation of membrane protease activity